MTSPRSSGSSSRRACSCSTCSSGGPFSHGGLPTTRPWRVTAGLNDQGWTLSAPCRRTTRPERALARRSIGCLSRFQSSSSNVTTSTISRPPTPTPIQPPKPRRGIFMGGGRDRQPPPPAVSRIALAPANYPRCARRSYRRKPGCRGRLRLRDARACATDPTPPPTRIVAARGGSGVPQKMHQRGEQDDAEGHAGGDRRARHAGEAPDGVRGTPGRARGVRGGNEDEGESLDVACSLVRGVHDLPPLYRWSLLDRSQTARGTRQPAALTLVVR